MKNSTDGEGFTLNDSQFIYELILLGETTLEGPITHLLDPADDTISMVSLMDPSIIFYGTNFEGTKFPPLVPDVTPTQNLSTISLPIVFSPSPTKVPQ